MCAATQAVFLLGGTELASALSLYGLAANTKAAIIQPISRCVFFSTQLGATPHSAEINTKVDLLIEVKYVQNTLIALHLTHI